MLLVLDIQNWFKCDFEGTETTAYFDICKGKIKAKYFIFFLIFHIFPYSLRELAIMGIPKLLQDQKMCRKVIKHKGLDYMILNS